MGNDLFNEKFLSRKINNIKIDVDFSAKFKILKRWHGFIKNKIIYSKKEEQLQADFLNEIFGEVLDYSYKRDSENVINLEKEYKTQIDGTKPDGVLGYFSSDKSVVKAVIELKDSNTNLDRNQHRKNDKRTPVEQAFSYVSKVGGSCDWVIVSNFIEIRLYASNDSSVYQKFIITDLINEDSFLKFYKLLSKSQLISNDQCSFTYNLVKSKIKADEEITFQFYNEYKNLRFKLFNHIKTIAPYVNKSIALSKTQKILDRIIFICFCEDLGLLPYKLLNQIRENYKNSFNTSKIKLYSDLKDLFNAIDQGLPERNINHFNGGLFKHDTFLDNLPIENEILLEVIDIEKYDFESELNVNILGHIFEQSISDLEELESNTINKRHNDGIYYTPNFITKYIIENTIGVWIEDKKKELGYYSLPSISDELWLKIREGRARHNNRTIQTHLKFWLALRDALDNIKIIDPACGSGSFLVQVFNYLKLQREYISSEIESLSGPQTDLFNIDSHILSDNIFGVDINTESVEITKLSLWLKTANKHDKLTVLDSNILCGNSLINDTSYDDKSFNWNESFSKIMNNGGFDIVITNPPYIDSETMTKFHLKEREFLSKNYTSAKGNYDIYIPFMEKCLNITKNNSYIAFITPDKYLSKNFGYEIRKLLLKNIVSIRKFGRAVFQDALVDSIVTILKNGNNKEIYFYDENNNLINTVYNSNIKDPYTLDIYFSKNYAIIDYIETNCTRKLSDYIKCENACATSDCYKLKSLIDDNAIEFKYGNYYKLINTGTISKYESNWGMRKIRYLKDSYLYPIVSKEDFHINFPNSYGEKSKLKKIIIKGLTLLDACIDTEGCIIPGKSTLIMCNDNPKLLFAILAYINSSLPIYYIKQKYSANSYNGGINFQKDMLNNLPIPDFNDDILNKLYFYGNELYNLSQNLHNFLNKFLILIETQFNVDKDKYYYCLDLDFNSFEKILKKDKVQLTTNLKDDWLLRFKSHKSQYTNLKKKIFNLINECNHYIFDLYKLPPEYVNSIKE